MQRERVMDFVYHLPVGSIKFLIEKKNSGFFPDWKAIFTDCAGWLFWPHTINEDNDPLSVHKHEMK